MIELRGVCKRVPSGSGTLTILHPLDLTIPSGRVVAITGPSGSGKSTLLGLAGRARFAVGGTRRPRRRGHHRARRRRARASARPAHRLRLPVLSPAPVADGAGERAGADGDCRRTRRSRGEPTRSSPKSGSPIARITIRRSSRAASSSASPSRARWPTIRRSSWPTSRPETWTARPATRSSSCCSNVNRARKTTIVLVTHDPELAALADVTVALRDGRVARVIGAASAEPAGGRRMSFVLRMAARELRASWRRLLFFFICVAVGVGAIVALRSIVQSVRAGLTREARDAADRGRRGPDQSRLGRGDAAAAGTAARRSARPRTHRGARDGDDGAAGFERGGGADGGAARGAGGLPVLRHDRARRTARRTRTIC